RRHTRSKRDWSSDVCSSDLLCLRIPHAIAGELALRLSRPSEDQRAARVQARRAHEAKPKSVKALLPSTHPTKRIQRRRPASPFRSEERRVGKECRSRGGVDV